MGMYFACSAPLLKALSFVFNRLTYSVSLLEAELGDNRSELHSPRRSCENACSNTTSPARVFSTEQSCAQQTRSSSEMPIRST
jgi:hypothetical protein